MKISEIAAGRAYTDNKGAVRLVLATGPEFVLYDGQGERDCLRYRLVAKKRGPDRVGDERNCTRASFAAWARAEVPVDNTEAIK